MIEAEGGDPDIVMLNHGNYTNPIYVPDSQESVFLPHPTPALPNQGCQPIPGLEWKTVGHKQINSLPTIGGNSYTAQVKRMTQNPPTQEHSTGCPNNASIHE
jgi:hypothetical protein